jgi:hypothetical protein
LILALACTALALAGCDAPGPDPGPQPTIETKLTDRDRLAGLAAAAKDSRYVGAYTWASADKPDRRVSVAFGSDGSWIVAVPGGALSGLADIAIYHSAAGLFQCLLGSSATRGDDRPDLGPLNPACVAMPSLAAGNDPRVQHIFTDWIDPLVDRATALSVAATTNLPGATGTCFSVESNSAALAPPLDPGVYCYADNGILTGARVGFGTLILSGTVSPAPPSVALPAPVAAGSPLPTTAPPPPAPTA